MPSQQLTLAIKACQHVWIKPVKHIQFLSELLPSQTNSFSPLPLRQQTASCLWIPVNWCVCFPVQLSASSPRCLTCQSQSAVVKVCGCFVFFTFYPGGGHTLLQVHQKTLWARWSRPRCSSGRWWEVSPLQRKTRVKLRTQVWAALVHSSWPALTAAVHVKVARPHDGPRFTCVKYSGQECHTTANTNKPPEIIGAAFS